MKIINGFIGFLIFSSAVSAEVVSRPPGLNPQGIRLQQFSDNIQQAQIAIAENRLIKGSNGQPSARDLLNEVLQADPFQPQAQQMMGRLINALIAYGETQLPDTDTAKKYWDYAQNLAVTYRMVQRIQPLSRYRQQIETLTLAQLTAPLEGKIKRLTTDLNRADQQLKDQQARLTTNNTPPTITIPSNPISNKTQRVKLRSTPQILSKYDVEAMLKKKKFYDKSWNPNGRFSGDLVDKGNGIVWDKTTGLEWQKGGSPEYMVYNKVQDYLDKVNKGLTGIQKWRLPRLEEAASLLRHQKNSQDRYIDALFDPQQAWIWTSDKELTVSSAARDVSFFLGKASWDFLGSGHYVRLCRSAG